MKINVRASPDGRLRTDAYRNHLGAVFSIAEVTAKGALVSEFKTNGEVVNQVDFGARDAAKALSEYLGRAELRLLESATYEHVKVDATCEKCGESNIERELDNKDTSLVFNVPVVPIFVCRTCGSRFYSMSDAYLRNLIGRNVSLFETGELDMRNTDESKFVGTLQEYIIRIFATKRIKRLKLRA